MFSPWRRVWGWASESNAFIKRVVLRAVFSRRALRGLIYLYKVIKGHKKYSSNLWSRLNLVPAAAWLLPWRSFATLYSPCWDSTQFNPKENMFTRHHPSSIVHILVHAGLDWTGLDRSIFRFSGLKIGLKIGLEILIQPALWKWILQLLVMKHSNPVIKPDMHVPRFLTLLSL